MTRTRQCSFWLFAVVQILSSASVTIGDETTPRPETNITSPRTVEELQARIDNAPMNGTIDCDPNRKLVVSKTVYVRKPLIIRGLSARLPDGLGKTTLLVVESEGVTVSDFTLRGNADTVEQSDRASLLVINAGRFRVENGRFENVTKNGLTIEPTKENPRDVCGGVVRNLVGDGVIRDVVSISGGDGTAAVRNIVVENIRGYRSRLRGVVEVSDGSQDITVRNIYAEDSVYAVDIQDHGDPKQINFNVLLDNITAVRCRHAVRFAVHDFGHRDITIQNVTAIDNEQPLHLKHVNRLTVTNARVFGSGEKFSPIKLTNIHGAILRDFFVEKVPHASHLVEIDDDSNHILLDGLICRDNLEKLKSVIKHDPSPNSDKVFLEVRNVLAGQIRGKTNVSKSPIGDSSSN